MSEWSNADSERLYNIPGWSDGYFGVEGGHLVARPGGAESASTDLYALVESLRRRGIEPPILVRFNDILRGRVRDLFGAFNRAREEAKYEAPYAAVFPIKVNQHRHLVEVIAEAGKEHGLGLEVGSRPELLAVTGLFADEGRLVICNGYKDHNYVETALYTKKLGCETVLVVEKFGELQTILRAADKLGVQPTIGVRTKLGGRGAGRWRDSGGDRSKFGLTTREIVLVIEELKRVDMLDCLKLLHFHLGSQITHIRAVKNALQEATQTLIGLHQLGAPIAWFDVGGGLGIDYDGSHTDFESSMNYSLQEYANDIVWGTKNACEAAGIPEPTILSESGRALTAHHAVLITEAMGVSDFSTVGVPSQAEPEEHEAVHRIAEVSDGVNAGNYQESYHDALQMRDEGMTLFNVGHLDLSARARIEEFFWRTCEKVLRITRRLEYVPDDLEHLERDMADTYFLNFSIFQSMPDSWAIQQLFPVVPIHRLDEEPTRRAVLADITCDSDGKVDRFIDLHDVKKVLELHPMTPGQPYYVAFFLVGAYQEILGDLHNLFGDTNVVHVDTDEAGRARLTHVTPGDAVEEVLSYVEYVRKDLTASLRNKIEAAIDGDRMNLEESRALVRLFERGLSSYTYLSTPEQAPGNDPG